MRIVFILPLLILQGCFLPNMLGYYKYDRAQLGPLEERFKAEDSEEHYTEGKYLTGEESYALQVAMQDYLPPTLKLSEEEQCVFHWSNIDIFISRPFLGAIRIEFTPHYERCEDAIVLDGGTVYIINTEGQILLRR